ncbi:hypothetical protein [Lysobacter claricitrinus]|uniref:hypothetical protein n=1 Tax=Lysobacter claricitrinus TaxID=3367728 RepID=UPI0037DB64EE
MPILNQDLEEIRPQWQARLADGLSPSTRAKRALLLVASTISLVVVILGVFPTKIDTLGVTLEGHHKNDILILLLAVNGYALVGFTIYAWADYHVHLRINKNARTGYITSFTRGQASLLESLNYLLRLLFDFFVPPLYGIYAIHRLVAFLGPHFLGAAAGAP